MRRRKTDRVILPKEEEVRACIKVAVNEYFDDNIGVLIDKIMDVVVKTIDIPFTVTQIAKITGMSKPAIYKMTQRDTIKSHKKNGSRLIFLKDIKDMLLPEIRKAVTTSV